MSRRRVNVGTAISRVIEDDKLPDSIKTGVTKALFKNGDIRDYLLEEVAGSIGVRAERMYAYARDHYTHGLPSGQFTTDAEAIEDVVGTVLLDIEETAVTIDYLRYGAPNSLHIGWMKLMELHGYDPVTNQLAGLTSIKGTPVYLHDMLVVIPADGIDTIEPFSLEQWGVAAKAGYTPHRRTVTPASGLLVQPTPIKVDPVGTDEFIRVDYTWVEDVAGVSTVMLDSFTIPLTGYDDDAEYFHVRYHVGAAVTYWMYQDGAGTHPTLDALFDKEPLSNGSFFPFAYFRYDHVSEIADTGTAAYQTSKKLVSYLGMDYDLISEGINSNPDIGDVRQAMLMMAVPANTTHPLEQRYLWEFFNNLHLASDPALRYKSEEQAAIHAFQVDQVGLRSPGIVIQDTRFKMSLDNAGIYKRRKAGSIGPVGSFSSAIGTQVIQYEFSELVGAGDGSGGVLDTYLKDAPIVSHYYRRQVSTGFYDEVQVVGLRTMFHIYEGYNTIGDEDDAILLIPLDRSITMDFSIPDREILYARSLHFVFNSLIVTKVKWYQTGLFKALLVIVGIVVIIISWGSATGPVATVLGMLSVGAYAAAFLIVMIMVVEYYIFIALFKLFVKAVGIEAAFVIAIIAAFAGVSLAIDAGSVAGAPFASDLLMLSTGLTDAIGAELQADMMGLYREAEEFDLLRKEQIKTLDTAKELLENSNSLSPFVIFGEKPDDFYNRTVHSGNIGVVGINAISYYVDTVLTLPKLSETLGDY